VTESVSATAGPFPAGSAWAGEPRALLEAAIRRHGGWAAWTACRSISVRPTTLRGLLPAWKGVGKSFPLPGRVDVRPHDFAAVFVDYPSAGRRGTFTAGALTLVDEGGAVAHSAADGRASFRGLAKYRSWSPADALYFFGYALTHYHGLPFTLVDGRPLGTCRVRHEGRTLAGVEVELPLGLHTHCRRQTFYFEEDGLLRRHDYVAEIAGSWARGAHFWRDFVTVAGLEIARERHVVARVGRWATPIVALHADLDVVDARPQGSGVDA
jgi:hypothetical protein